MKRSAFAKLSDAIQFQPVVVEKVVVRRDVETLRPKRSKIDSGTKKALDQGHFLEAMRALADFETAQCSVEQSRSKRELARTIHALRSVEHEYAHARACIVKLPRCTEKDVMMSVLEKSDTRARKVWDWVISQATQLESPTESRRQQQRRRRRNKRLK